MPQWIFDGSSRLVHIIQQKDWTLYDVTDYLNLGKPFRWEDLQKNMPAQILEHRSNYVFVPVPKAGESLRDAYSVTKGLGPSIWVPNPDAHQDMDGAGPLIIDGNMVYLFTRLFFEDDGLYATTPRSSQLPQPPCLRMLYRVAVDKFERYFRIATREDIDRRSTLDGILGKMN